MLVHAGVSESAISVLIQKRRGGVARDILAETYRGEYDALVIGRKGMGGIEESILGSVASRTVSRLAGVSVWLVGGRPKKGRILVAVDASEGAMRAVEHLGRMLDGMPYDITLLHVVRGINVLPLGYESIFPEGYRNRLVEEAENGIKPTFELAVQKLRALGFKPDRISTRVLTGVASRAGAIFQEATAGNYGTVVVGRRGISHTEDFDMGRVTRKLSQLSRDIALWIVA
jgi:nucleotide-binding universal stress UspA family protein